jgi:hypothetical protein
VQSGDRLYFDHLSQALAFIREHFGGYDHMLGPEATDAGG